MVLLGKNGLLPVWVRNRTIIDIFFVFPFEWNSKLQRFQLKPEKKLKQYELRLTVATLYGVLMLIQIMATHEESSGLVRNHSVLFFTGYLLSFFCHYGVWTELYGTVGLYNDLIDYERHHLKRKQLDSSKKNIEEKPLTNLTIIKHLMNMVVCSFLGMTSLYHLDIVRNPCFPSYVGYWWSKQCQGAELGIGHGSIWSGVELLKKVVISAVSHFNWIFFLGALFYQGMVHFLLIGECLRSHILDYERALVTTKKFNPSIEERTRDFRKLQLILVNYRSYYSRVVLLFFMIIMMVIQISSFYYSIVMMRIGISNFSLFGFALFLWIGIFCAILIIFIFGKLSDVYKTSRKADEKITGNVQLMSNKWFNKWHNSCPILKVHFGGLNYLEETTPLAMEDFVISQIVNLLLLK